MKRKLDNIGGRLPPDKPTNGSKQKGKQFSARAARRKAKVLVYQRRLG